MEKVKSDMVEATVVVREYCWVELDTRQKAFGSQAVSTPLLPEASEFREGGGEEGFCFKKTSGGKFCLLKAGDRGVAVSNVIADRVTFITIAKTPNIPAEKVKDTNFTCHFQSLNTQVYTRLRPHDRGTDR